MRIHWLSVPLLLGGLTLSAAAEQPAAPKAPPPDEALSSIALAINSPTSWLLGGGFSYAASAYAGLSRHHALRGNFALYTDSISLRPLDSVHGQIVDGGIAWVWYPRKLWDGFTFEAGALVRDRDTLHWPEMSDKTETDSTTISGRAMIGWSWLITRRAFIAIAAGISVGREFGSETITPDSYSAMPTTRSVNRTQIDGEGYLRIGYTFSR